MAWHNFIKIAGLDTSLTDEEAASLPEPEPDPSDLAPCPPQYFELFQGGITVTNVDEDTPGETPEDEDITTQLQAWLDEVDRWFGEDWEKWIDDTIAFSESEGSRGDLPVPIPPQLPDLTDFISLPALIAQFGPWGIVIFVGIRVVKRLVEGWIEKKMNPGVGELKQMLQDIRDALKKGLLYNDGADALLKQAFLFDDGLSGANQSILKAGLLFTDVFDNKLKGALERGLLKNVTIVEGETTVTRTLSILELMKMSIDDLAFVDAIIDFGAFRCHIRGKMIEY